MSSQPKKTIKFIPRKERENIRRKRKERQELLELSYDDDYDENNNYTSKIKTKKIRNVRNNNNSNNSRYRSRNNNNISNSNSNSNSNEDLNLNEFPSLASSSNNEGELDIEYSIKAGKCLSMHQPWASLLVAGIKQVEGRVWSSNFKGFLWIASAAKEVTNHEILYLEEEYALHYKTAELNYPKHYPVGVLLGYVYVEKVMTNAEYIQYCRENDIDNEKTQSPYLFFCSKPTMLPYPIQVKGQHKIWKLDTNILKQALMQFED